MASKNLVTKGGHSDQSVVTVSELSVVCVTMGSTIVAARKSNSKRGYVFIGLLVVAAAFVVVTANGKTCSRSTPLLFYQIFFALLGVFLTWAMFC